jgi:hypothetical protein
LAIHCFDLRVFVRAALATVALLICTTALADPPIRVARMASIDGAVSFSPAGEDEWVLATLNRPLITGDRVWTDAEARSELQIGSLAVRLGSQTSVSVLNLDDRVAQIQLQQGTLNVRVRRLNPDETVEVDTPLLAFTVRRPGVYRIDVDATSAATTIAIRSGEGEAYGEGAAYTISERQWYRFADTALRDYEYDVLPPADAFDAWTQDLDRRQDHPVSARYVSPDVIGYSDLDDYGTWSTAEGYGNVWVPTQVASDWAPYREGHWAWIEPWGWTWVDNAPWGFAPFHYGRWAYVQQRWCWVPGPPRARAVYAPALVAFVGGSNFRVSVGAGGPARGVAWFPLAPGEVYRPSYQVSRNYFTNVNVSNTNVTNNTVINIYNRPEAANTVYRNRDQRGGVTAMPATAFAQSRPVAQSSATVSREVAIAGPVTSIAPVAPVLASVIGGSPVARPGVPASGPSSRPPAAVLRRPTVVRAEPPPSRAPFQARESALAKDPGRPADPAVLVAPRSGSASQTPSTVKVLAPSAGGTPPPAPTLTRARTNEQTQQPANVPQALPAPVPGSTPVPPPRSSPGTPIVQPPSVAPAQPKPPARPEPTGSTPKVDASPQTPAQPVRVPPAQPAQSSTQPASQVPRPPELRPVQPAPSGAALPPKGPAELRRERPQPPGTDTPAPTVPAEQMRRDVRPAAPPATNAPLTPAPAPAQVRRETLPPPAVKPPVPVVPPPQQPIVRPPPPPPAVVPAQPTSRQPEVKAQPGKTEAPKPKPDDRRDEPK